MKNIYCSVLCISAICSTLWAGEIPVSANPITLNQVLQIAEQRNPDILAARKEWESAKERVRSVRTWPDPEVGVEFWGFSRSGLNVGSSEEKWYDISQTIPFPGKLILRGKSAEHGARRQEEVYRASKLDVLSKVKEAYYDYLYAERAAQITNENLEVIRRFAKISESKYGTGKTTQSDVLRAQTELSKMLNMLVTTAQERETSQAKLNSLMDRRPEEPLGAAEEPGLAPIKYTFDELEQMALQTRPEVHAAAHHIAHMEAELKAVKADYLPDPTLQYTWRTREGMESDAVALVKFNLPFIWFGRQRSMIRSTQKEKEHADATLRSAVTLARYEVKEYWIHVQTSRRLVDLYKTSVLPQAEQSIKVSEAAYQSGRAGFLDLLDSERALINFQLEYYKYLSEYGKNLAHLERAVGGDLTEAHHE